MTIRRKTILAISVTLAVLVVLLYAVLRTLLMSSFSTLEQEVTLRDLNRAETSLQDRAASMERAIHDWSSWGETYSFVQNGNDAFIDSNLEDSTFWTLDVNLMLFVNNANEIVYSKAVGLEADWPSTLLAQVEDYARSSAGFLRLTTDVPTAGLVVVDGEPLLIASRPILHDNDTGPKSGTLIWGRYLGKQELLELSQTLRLSVDLASLSAPKLSKEDQAARTALSVTMPQMITPVDERTIDGYALLNDIYGQPAFLLKTTQDRAVYTQGQASLIYFIAALAVVGIVFAVVVLLLLERLILAPLSHLSVHVRQIGVHDDFSMRLPTIGHDEFSQLASTLNTMLTVVVQSRATLQQWNTDLEQRVSERTLELERQKAQLQTIMDTMGEGLVYCVDGRITYANRLFVQLIDYQVSDLIGKPLSLLNAPMEPEQPPVYLKMPECYETTLTRRDGTSVDVAITSTRVNTADSDQPRRVFILRDITERKAAERTLQAKAQEERAFQSALMALHKISLDLTQLDSLDPFYQNVVELGFSRLGFERLALFLYDAPAGSVQGTYGTDPHGQTRDEHTFRMTPDADDILMRVLEHTERFCVIEPTPLHDNEQAMGVGWNAAAALWSGSRDGWLVGRR